LRTLFKSAIRNLENASVVCSIDTLDESDEKQIQDMVRLFVRISDGVRAMCSLDPFRKATFGPRRAVFNLASLIELRLDSPSYLKVEIGRWDPFLFVLIACGRNDAAQVCMERLQAGYISEECPEELDRHGSIKPWFSYTTSNGIISNTVALGDKRVLSLLLDLNRFPVDLPGLERRTLSLWASKNGCVVLVKLLLDKEGINVNSKDFDCRTPLYIAAAIDHCAAMKLLL
jgi:hypothetical protein